MDARSVAISTWDGKRAVVGPDGEQATECGEGLRSSGAAASRAGIRDRGYY